MSDEIKGTTVFLDPETIAKADAIVRELSGLVGGKMSRSAVARRAIHDLFLSVCPIDLTNEQAIRQPTEAINA